MSNLVIVESPAKAKTIKKHLGKGFEVLASNGHVRDLPKSKIGVDIENNFEPEYINIRGKGKLINALRKEAKESDIVYLATDPDREGEAISWHLANLLDIDVNKPVRVTFNEITKTGIKNGMDNPRIIDMDLVDSQQARRVLDRLVGYQLSPFLWRKVRKGLSAGRVQSVAVKIIVDREKEIRAFVSEEYWSIVGTFIGDDKKNPFEAILRTYKGNALEIHNEEEANKILAAIKNQEYKVTEVKKSVRKRNPSPPFTTSTLQQQASSRLGFQARRTMQIAQELYEGIDVKDMGAVGLITYMRTDSLRISDEAIADVQKYIGDTYGKEYLPEKVREYKTKKVSQDGHEAIRPTMPSLTPAEVQDDLSPDQFKLYKLIWERFVACQMSSALLDAVSARIDANGYVFNASGYTVKFDGYTRVFGIDEEEEKEQDNKDELKKGALPELKEGDMLDAKKITPNQHFTQPPPRYTEASLIKSLEENGIGRPSTYAPTISTIISRNYVERDARALLPTELGEIINGLMEEQFANIVDVDFTANMEKDLDSIEEGKNQWKKVLSNFYDGFAANLEQAEKNMEGKRIDLPVIETDEICELCGKNMVVKEGRFGRFLACPGFPDCRNTKPFLEFAEGICPVCGKRIVSKKSKKGRAFYGCEGYPECTFMSWDPPVKETCPKCTSTLFQKAGKTPKTYCLKEGCGYERIGDE